MATPGNTKIRHWGSRGCCPALLRFQPFCQSRLHRSRRRGRWMIRKEMESWSTGSPRIAFVDGIWFSIQLSSILYPLNSLPTARDWSMTVWAARTRRWVHAESEADRPRSAFRPTCYMTDQKLKHAETILEQFSSSVILFSFFFRGPGEHKNVRYMLQIVLKK